MVPGSIGPTKSGGDNFSHGISVLNSQFKTTSNILDVLPRIRQTIIVIQVHHCDYKIFGEMRI